MIKEAIGFGNTVDEARESAALKLGARDTDDIQFEVISLPKKKTLGLFGGSKAEVKAFIVLPDKPKKNAKQKNQKGDAQKEKSAPKKENKQKKQDKATPKTAKTVEFNGIPADKLEAGSPAKRAVEYLTSVLEKLGVENIEFLCDATDNGANLVIKGENLGVVIGRRGETLDALQHLASLAASDKDSKYYRIVLDTENYREKREKTLESLASRTARSALKSGRQRSLEPMNPYERRIIHTTVQGIDGVSSHSVGEGAHRHVVITPDKKSNYKPAQKTETAAPKKIDDFGSLYGRID